MKQGIGEGRTRADHDDVSNQLYSAYAEGMDLRTPLRDGLSSQELSGRIAATWAGRADRGAEDRLGLAHRRTPIAREELEDQPHREMHTRGG